MQRSKHQFEHPTTSYKVMEVQVRMVDALQGRTQGSFSSQTSPNFSRDDVHKSGRSIESVSSFKWWFQLFCGVFTPQKKHWAQYLYLPRGAVWMVRGAYTPSLRVQTAPFGRRWYVSVFFFGGKAWKSNVQCRCLWLFFRWHPYPPKTDRITYKVGPGSTYKWGYNFEKWGCNPSYPVIRPLI